MWKADASLKISFEDNFLKTVIMRISKELYFMLFKLLGSQQE